MTDCERIEPFYAHTVAPAVTAIIVPIVILAWCYTVEPTFVYVLAPFYIGTTVILPWLVSKLGGDGVDYRRQLGEVNAFVSDSIQGVRDTVAFGYEKQRAKQLFNIGATMQEGQEKTLRRRCQSTGVGRNLYHHRYSGFGLVGHFAGA